MTNPLERYSRPQSAVKARRKVIKNKEVDLNAISGGVTVTGTSLSG